MASGRRTVTSRAVKEKTVARTARNVKTAKGKKTAKSAKTVKVGKTAEATKKARSAKPSKTISGTKTTRVAKTAKRASTKSGKSAKRLQVSKAPIDSRAVERAREFVAKAEISRPNTKRGALSRSTVDLSFETAKNQAAVVGSEVVSFVSGVTAERRDAIVSSSLLAQLVAKKKVSDPARIYDWYDAYFDVLTNIGWVVQEKSFAEYRESSQNFAAHEAILAVATTLLGAAPAALAVVSSTLKALKSMDENSSWITVFSRESQHAKTARFQISLAEQDESGQFFVSLMAFGLEAKSSITQVLFFRIRKNEATLKHYAGKVTINTDVLDAVRDAIKAKLSGIANEYVKALPDLELT